MSNNSNVDYDGTAYFFSMTDTEKVKSLKKNKNVTLLFQGDEMLFIEASGKGKLITSRSIMFLDDEPSPSAVSGSTQHSLVPYLGLGFLRGTTTDVSGTMMRETSQQASIQDERLLRDMVGRSVTPSEVQLGIRLPF